MFLFSKSNSLRKNIFIQKTMTRCKMLCLFTTISSSKGFPGSSAVKNLLAMQETQVWSLGWEDPLEKRMATHSNILGWRIPWTVHAKSLQSCPTLCNPMDFTWPWILDWVAFPFSRGSSQPRGWTQVSCIAGSFFTSCATREALYIINYSPN